MKKLINIFLTMLVGLSMFGCTKDSEESSIEQSKDKITENTSKGYILDHMTFKDIKLSEVYTVNDVLEKYDIEINGVVAMYFDEESSSNSSYSYEYDEFLSDEVSKENLKLVGFPLITKDKKAFNVLVSYEVFKEKGLDSPYYEFEVVGEDSVLLDDKSIESIAYSDIESQFDVSLEGNENSYTMSFENSNGVNYSVYVDCQYPHVSLYNMDVAPEYE